MTVCRRVSWIGIFQGSLCLSGVSPLACVGRPWYTLYSQHYEVDWRLGHCHGLTIESSIRRSGQLADFQSVKSVFDCRFSSRSSVSSLRSWDYGLCARRLPTSSVFWYSQSFLHPLFSQLKLSWWIQFTALGFKPLTHLWITVLQMILCPQTACRGTQLTIVLQEEDPIKLQKFTKLTKKYPSHSSSPRIMSVHWMKDGSNTNL